MGCPEEVGGKNISTEASEMAAAVPLSFLEFHLSNERKMMKKMSFEVHLLIAMAAIDKLRQRTLLPQYAGRAVNKIFDVPPNTTPTAAEENPFEKAVKALINYFRSQKKTRV